MIPVLLINTIKEVKGHSMQGCVNMSYYHKYTEYIDVRESHLGHNYPNRRLGFGYEHMRPPEY